MKLTLIKDLRKEFGDKNCASKSFECSPYVLLDKKEGETLEGKLFDSTKVQLVYEGAKFVVDKSYFKDFNQGSFLSTNKVLKKSKTKLYIGIIIGVVAIGTIAFFIIKRKK